jgi:uncharacterized protein YjbJ (UPF0337 family)
MVLERTWFRGALIRTGSALPARSKAAYAFNDVSNLVRFLVCAFGMPIGRNDSDPHCGRSGIITFNNQMSSYDVYRTIRDLEQYIDEVVALHIQQTNNEDLAMDKDRIKGSAEQAKGAVKETVGKVFGDKKLETDGKTDKAAGKVQNAIGGLKDAVRGK